MVEDKNEENGPVGRPDDSHDQPDTQAPVIRWCAPDKAAQPHDPPASGEETHEQNRERERTARVAALNDLCRTALGVGGIVRQTLGISALPRAVQSAIRERVETFNAFNANDPYGERDFGVIEYEGHRVYWKIDYYDLDLEGGSEDPSDVTQTTRVLTIMLASEY